MEEGGNELWFAIYYYIPLKLFKKSCINLFRFPSICSPLTVSSQFPPLEWFLKKFLDNRFKISKDGNVASEVSVKQYVSLLTIERLQNAFFVIPFVRRLPAYKIE